MAPYIGTLKVRTFQDGNVRSLVQSCDNQVSEPVCLGLSVTDPAPVSHRGPPAGPASPTAPSSQPLSLPVH